MNLSKHDPETDMDLNMTSMIDVVFLLIIFFMIITDLTQQDLEELELPVAKWATPDNPDPKEWRPIINIPYDGKMVVRGEKKYDPELDDSKSDPDEEIKFWITTVSKKMKKAHFDPDAKTGPLIPDEALLIRADQSTSFKHIQKVMEFCGATNVQIWKIQLAASEEGEEIKDRRP